MDGNGFLDVIETSDGGILCSGYTSRLDTAINFPQFISWLIKLDSSGCYSPGCEDGWIVLESGEPVVEEKPLNMWLSPNPASGLVEIFLPVVHLKGEALLKVFSAIGQCKTIMQLSFADSAILDVSDFEAGAYFVRFENGAGQSWQSKLIVTK